MDGLSKLKCREWIMKQMLGLFDADHPERAVIEKFLEIARADGTVESHSDMADTWDEIREIAGKAADDLREWVENYEGHEP